MRRARIFLLHDYEKRYKSYVMRNEIKDIVVRVERMEIRRDAYRRRLRRHRVSPPLVLILRLLESYPGLTMVELARRLGISVPTMQSRMSRLETLGLINRRRSVDDRRRVPTELSPRGKQLLRRVPLAGAGRILEAVEKGEVTPRRLRRLAVELEHVERLLFPEEDARVQARARTPVWMR
jgi:DNA-binding MarR family transcriptional regulator